MIDIEKKTIAENLLTLNIYVDTLYDIFDGDGWQQKIDFHRVALLIKPLKDAISKLYQDESD